MPKTIPQLTSGHPVFSRHTFTTYAYVVTNMWICREDLFSRHICSSRHINMSWGYVVTITEKYVGQHICTKSLNTYLTTYSSSTHIASRHTFTTLKWQSTLARHMVCQSDDTCFYMCWGTSDMSWPHDMSWQYVLSGVVRICVEISLYVVKVYVLIVCADYMSWNYMSWAYVLIICREPICLDYMCWFYVLNMFPYICVEFMSCSYVLRFFFFYVLSVYAENPMSYITQC